MLWIFFTCGVYDCRGRDEFSQGQIGVFAVHVVFTIAGAETSFRRGR